MVSWDITFLASAIRGAFCRLYLVEDIFSREIVGWEVRKASLAEGIRPQGLVCTRTTAGQ